MAAPIIIMGANGGIGGALAERLYESNIPLFLTARDTSGLLDGVTSAEVDVTDEDAVQHAIAEADTGEGIAGLAYCIGTLALKSFKAARVLRRICMTQNNNS